MNSRGEFLRFLFYPKILKTSHACRPEAFRHSANQNFSRRSDQNAKHKPMSESNLRRRFSPSALDIAFTRERLGVDSIRKKLTALSVNSLCDVVRQGRMHVIGQASHVSLPTQRVLKLIEK